MSGVWASLGVVTGGPLVRLMEVIWVVVIMAGVLAVFSVITDGFSGFKGRDGGPGGGGGGTWFVVLDGGRGGRRPGPRPRSLVFAGGGAGVEGILEVAGGVGDLSLVRAGEGERGDIGPCGVYL